MGYPNGVVSFTTKNPGDTIQASHIDDLQTEVTAIEAGLLQGTGPINSSHSTLVALSVSGGSTVNTLQAGNSTFAGGFNLSGNSTLNSSMTIGTLPYVFPAAGGSTGQVLAISSTSGSTMTLAWQALTGPQLVASGLSSGQIGAVGSVCATTVGGADTSFDVSANVLVTTATNHSFNVRCLYTDQGNSTRALLLNFTLVGAASQTVTVSNGNGTVPYMGQASHIRCKAGTTVTVETAGTFTSVAYDVCAWILKVF